MKEYFFLKDKEQNGPFTLEQLSDKGLTSETHIWTDGMENWEKLKNIPELAQILKPKTVPPLPPKFGSEERVSKTEVSGQIKVTTEKTPNIAIEAIKQSKVALTWLIIWCAFHLFALLMSYSGVGIFNDRGSPKTDSFWPFVKFCTDIWDEPKDYWNNRNSNANPPLLTAKKVGCEFDGLFVDYDWSEFAFYVVGAIIIYVLVRISKKQNKVEQLNI